MTEQDHPIVALVNRGKQSLAEALRGSPVTFDKFVVGLKAACMTNPELVECVKQNPQSVMQRIVEAAQLGLSPAPAKQHFYLIPRRIKGELTCTSIVGFRGLIDLAVRSGQIEDLGADIVYKGDDFAIDQTTGAVLHANADPFREFDGKAVRGAYAWAKVTGRPRIVSRTMSIGEIRKRRGIAQTDKIWSEWPKEMILKTVLRALLTGGLVPLGEGGDRLAEVEAAQEEEIRAAEFSEPGPPADAYEKLPGWLGEEPGQEGGTEGASEPAGASEANLEPLEADAETRKRRFCDLMAEPTPLGPTGLIEAIGLMDDEAMMKDEGFLEHVSYLTDEDKAKVRDAAKARKTELES